MFDYAGQFFVEEAGKGLRSAVSWTKTGAASDDDEIEAFPREPLAKSAYLRGVVGHDFQGVHFPALLDESGLQGLATLVFSLAAKDAVGNDDDCGFPPFEPRHVGFASGLL